MMKASEIAQSAYRKAVEAATTRKVSASVAECQAAARKAVLDALENGTIASAEANEGYARAQAQAAHLSLVDAGKRLVRRVLDGQAAFDDLLESVICPLGDGVVTTFDAMTATQLAMADSERYRNLRDAQDAYSDWREVTFEPSSSVLIQTQLTFGEAVRQQRIKSSRRV